MCLGAAFTFFLTYFAEDDHRRLAGGDSHADDGDTQQERSAHLFCGALAVCFATLDGMTAAHIGIDEGRKRLTSTHKKNVVGIVLLGIRLAIIPFIATASLWETNPSRLSLIGFFCVSAQLVLRKLGSIFLSHKQVHALDPKYSSERHDRPRDLRQSVLLASALVNLAHEFEDPSNNLDDDASTPPE